MNSWFFVVAWVESKSNFVRRQKTSLMEPPINICFITNSKQLRLKCSWHRMFYFILLLRIHVALTHVQETRTTYNFQFAICIPGVYLYISEVWFCVNMIPYVYFLIPQGINSSRTCQLLGILILGKRKQDSFSCKGEEKVLPALFPYRMYR